MAENNTKGRHTGVDVLKIICAFFVVCLHQRFPGKLGDIVVVIARCAVPLFFICSGYFFKRSRMVKKLYNTASIFVGAYMFYFLIGCILSFFSNVNIGDYIMNYISKGNIIQTLVFNSVSLKYHLWFLLALIYTLMVYTVIDFLGEKYLLYVKYFIIILVIIGVILSQHLLWISPISDYYWRNYLFIGIPFFGIGYYIKKYESRVITFLESKNLRSVFVVMFILIIGLFAEWNCYLRIGSGDGELFFFLVPLCACIFIYFRYFFTGKRAAIDCIGRWGREYSLVIYIIHPFYCSIIGILFVKMDWYISSVVNSLLYICPVLIFCISVLSAFILKKYRFF